MFEINFISICCGAREKLGKKNRGRDLKGAPELTVAFVCFNSVFAILP